MNWSLFKHGKSKLPNRLVAVDMGTRTTKALELRRDGPELALCGWTTIDSMPGAKVIAPAALTEHLQAITERLHAETTDLALTIGLNDAVVRTIEMPLMSIDDFRSVLKVNSRRYLQQDLPDFVFDGHKILYFGESDAPKAAAASAKVPKQRVLLAGAKKQLVDSYVEGCKGAGLNPRQVVPGLVGPVNALESAFPDPFHNEVLAIIDMGFHSTSICLLKQGEFVLSRTVGIGGDQLTTSLSTALNVSYAEAESIKIGIATEVQSELETALAPLCHELQASINYFEHEHDKLVNRAFICGGSAQSACIVDAVQTSLQLRCCPWNPTQGLKKELSSEQATGLENVAPQLAVAVGTALSAM